MLKASSLGLPSISEALRLAVWAFSPCLVLDSMKDVCGSRKTQTRGRP